MRQKAMRGLLALLLSGILMSCGTMRALLPETQTTLVYPRIDPALLLCPAEPKVPQWVETDVDFAEWSEGVRVSGTICRIHLGKVRDLVATWPKND